MEDARRSTERFYCGILQWQRSSVFPHPSHPRENHYSTFAARGALIGVPGCPPWQTVIEVQFDAVTPWELSARCQLSREVYQHLNHALTRGAAPQLRFSGQFSTTFPPCEVEAEIATVALEKLPNGLLSPVAKLTLGKLSLGGLPAPDALGHPRTRMVVLHILPWAWPFDTLPPSRLLREEPFDFELKFLDQPVWFSREGYRLALTTVRRESAVNLNGHAGAHGVDVGAIVAEITFAEGEDAAGVLARLNNDVASIQELLSLSFRGRWRWVERYAYGNAPDAGIFVFQTILPCDAFTAPNMFPILTSFEQLRELIGTGMDLDEQVRQDSTRALHFLQESWRLPSDEARFTSLFLGIEALRHAYSSRHSLDFWLPVEEHARFARQARKAIKTVLSEGFPGTETLLPPSKEKELLRRNFIDTLRSLVGAVGAPVGDLYPEFSVATPKAVAIRNSLFHQGKLADSLGLGADQFQDEVARLSCLLERLLLAVLGFRNLDGTRVQPPFDRRRYRGGPWGGTFIFGYDDPPDPSGEAQPSTPPSAATE